MGLTSHSTWKFNVPHSFGVHHAARAGPLSRSLRAQRSRGGQEVCGGREAADRVRHSGQGRRASLRNPSRAWAAWWCFPMAISSTPTSTCAPPAECASPMKCRPASAARARISGASRTQGVIPDIVTMAKGIGNGCPLAAVVTTPQDRRRAGQADSLQHLRRQPGGLRHGQGRAGSDRARESPGKLAEAGQLHFGRPGKAEGETQHHRRRARQGA